MKIKSSILHVYDMYRTLHACCGKFRSSFLGKSLYKLANTEPKLSQKKKNRASKCCVSGPFVHAGVW